MRVEEAQTLADWVLGLELPPGTVCLNIGSSTARFRQHDQPHIQERFIGPLEEAGIRFVHCDMKQAEGVDEVGDVFDPAFRARLQAHDAGIIVCSNLLEHLTAPEAFARACGDLVRDGGYGLFSVPSSYPYHPDPIDTMLRLKPNELAALLPDWTAVKAREIEAGSYWQDLRKSGAPWWNLAKQVGRTALPFYRPRHWRSIASRLSWLGRPYRVSLALLKKPQREAA
jgi:SAM-dependent methyltransferase